MFTGFDTTEFIYSLQHGERSAFEVIFERLYPSLVTYAYDIIGNEQEAQDIAATSLEKCFEKCATMQNKKHYECFLFLCTRNAALTYLRRMKSFTGNYNAYIEQAPDEIELINFELDSSLLINLHAAIEKLPIRSKQVIEGLFMHKHSYSKVAELMNTTVKNVENLRTYALLKMKQYLLTTGGKIS